MHAVVESFDQESEAYRDLPNEYALGPYPAHERWRQEGQAFLDEGVLDCGPGLPEIFITPQLMPQLHADAFIDPHYAFRDELDSWPRRDLQPLTVPPPGLPRHQ
ncbi:unnamed protein product [Symbiodinium sp. CCMP2592]|nr:unnamed protein product [Symbiodinium sp. CCMP2592]